MNYSYWLHEKIQSDFNEGYAWYENKRKGLGLDFLEAIEKKLAEIISNPEIFSSKSNPHYREARVDRFPYVIVYRLYKQKKEIFISAVHHLKKSQRKKYRKP
jgi:plasmid stabilization system protein ParE